MTLQDIIQPNTSASASPLPHSKRNEDLVISHSLAAEAEP